MKNSIVSRLIIIVALAAFAAGCANTIRGVGKDVKSSANAVEDAVN
ncbi:EncA/B family entericidin [Mesorhizobium koreense]|jgi:predicted small secreted protein|nr:EncA/B family entericidin [Mesorhizobium sp. WR6]